MASCLQGSRRSNRIRAGGPRRGSSADFPENPCPPLLQVSKASSELMSYCEQHARNDPLLVGVPASENPFKDKKPCIIL
ncbi:hypothetical protein FD755_001030 [Muntiacus reevesi]|uniref:Guanine nucleotide-binding protein subunit gamma n=1 Tax=Muntiacus reevesi TaxID=9886 RepID=A0A5J5N263_MUNRE|nr:hypothetical protein FD755_001030 [Muntiacus reevesi]